MERTDLLDLPPLAGDWRGQVGLEIESRWRGHGAVLVSGYDSRAVEVLAGWRLLQRTQIGVLAGIGNRSRAVVDRLFRLGLVDRITVAGVIGYALSGYTLSRLRMTAAPWTGLRALRLLAGNRLGEVLVRAAGGQWIVEPDAVLAALWTVGGETYSVYAYRYWPGAEREAALVLGAVPGRIVMLVPRRADAEQLVRGCVVRDPDRVRWTWDGAIQPGVGVQFWRQVGEGLEEAETIRI